MDALAREVEIEVAEVVGERDVEDVVEVEAAPRPVLLDRDRLVEAVAVVVLGRNGVGGRVNARSLRAAPEGQEGDHEEEQAAAAHEQQSSSNHGDTSTPIAAGP